MSVMAETYYSSNFIIGEINYLKLRSLKVIANDTVMHTYHPVAIRYTLRTSGFMHDAT